jgi:diguanylate cyclase (GGDEF)-like protein/PAS domain S-box-containing protein
VALAWSVELVRRIRDWRIATLTAMLVLMVVSEGLLMFGQAHAWPIITLLRVAELPNLLVSVLALLAVMVCGWVISDSRRIERELAVEKAYLERLFESAPEATVLVDNGSRILRINTAFSRLFGYAPAEVVGRNVDELLAPPDLLEEAQGITQEVAGGRDVARETVRCRKDGSRVDVAIVGAPVRTDDGQVAVYGIYRDITQRKRAEEALRVSEEKFSKAFQSSPDILTLSTIDDGVLIDVNDTFVTVTGYTREELLGRPANAVNLWANPADREDLVDQLRSTGAARNLECSFRMKSGELREALLSAELLDIGGRRCMLTVSNDITERKQQERALQASEERYALAARGANDGLWDWDVVSDRVYFSARWKAIVGCLEEDIGTSPDEWFRRVHAMDVERLRSGIAAHLDGRSAHFENEHRILCKDGSYRWVLSRGLAVRDAEGKPLRIAGSMTDVSLRKLAEEKLLHEAIHDVLTGLPNRALFMDLLGRSVARGRRRKGYLFAVLFLDLDRFKVINDGLGHLVGDQLLVGLARRLEKCLRPEDTVARLGGDEFTVLLDDINDASDATRVAERIHHELKTPFEIAGHEVYTTVSIGIALSTTGYEIPDHILRDADTAMYRAKAMGKARHELFDTGMHARAVALLQLETDLRRAIEHREFRLYYQPIVTLNGQRRVVGFEALVRWQHPQRGLLLPAEFVATAEETGLMLPVGYWVLGEACRQIREWSKQVRRPLIVTVNLSNRQFALPDLPDRISEILTGAGLPAEQLKLEITESAMMEYGEAVTVVLEQLRKLGVDFYIDDFGTGYSSFSALRRFPVTTLKIDHSFVRALDENGDGAEIVRTILTLARNLDLNVIAEGVETKTQLDQLRALKCPQAQGSLFAEARPADAAVEILLKGSRR